MDGTFSSLPVYPRGREQDAVCVPRRNAFGLRLRSAYPVGVLPYEISVAELDSLQRKGVAPTLVDVREPWEVNTAALPGAVNIPMGEVPARAHQELDPEAPVIVLCHHGARSLSVTNWLRQQGFDQAQSLAGGIDQWSREIDGTVPRY